MRKTIINGGKYSGEPIDKTTQQWYINIYYYITKA